MITDDFRRNFNELLEQYARGARTALAEELGVSRPYISQLCKGERVPNLETLEKIAAFFNVTPLRLLRPDKKLQKTG